MTFLICFRLLGYSVVSEGTLPFLGFSSTMAGDDFSPPSSLGDSLLDNPLCGDLMDDLREISQSLGDGSLGFDFQEYQSAEPEGSSTLGEDWRARLRASVVQSG